MRKTATLLLLFTTSVLQAKTNGENKSPTPFPHFTTQEHLSSGMVSTRITAKTYSVFHNNIFINNDSVAYIYNSGRGGSPDIYDDNDDNVNYSESYSYTYSQGQYQNKLHRKQDYDVNDQILKLQYWPWKNNLYKDSLYYTYSYANNIINNATAHIFAGGNWGNSLAYYNTIISGNVVEVNGTIYHYFFGYDANDNLVSEINANGSLSSLQYLEKDSFEYDANNRLIVFYICRWNVPNAFWENSEYWTYTYSTNDIISIEKQKWQSNAWAKNEKENFSYDAHHNRISDITLKWDNVSNTYDNDKKLTWTYNNNDQPLQLISFTWATGSWVNANDDYRINFSYESYSPTKINNIENSISLSLYPSPASDNLTISFNLNKQQNLNVSIVNMQGQTVMQWAENDVKRYQKSIPLSALPDGYYVMSVGAADGTIASKRFAVMH